MVRIVNFQVVQESDRRSVLFVLCDDGVLWTNALPINPESWTAIRMPSEQQKMKEVRAEEQRSYDISHPEAKSKSSDLSPAVRKLYEDAAKLWPSKDSQ